MRNWLETSQRLIQQQEDAKRIGEEARIEKEQRGVSENLQKVHSLLERFRVHDALVQIRDQVWQVGEISPRKFGYELFYEYQTPVEIKVLEDDDSPLGSGYYYESTGKFCLEKRRISLQIGSYMHTGTESDSYHRISGKPYNCLKILYDKDVTSPVESLEEQGEQGEPLCQNDVSRVHPKDWEACFDPNKQPELFDGKLLTICSEMLKESSLPFQLQQQAQSRIKELSSKGILYQTRGDWEEEEERKLQEFLRQDRPWLQRIFG